jgi:hypothetical protein
MMLKVKSNLQDNVQTGILFVVFFSFYKVRGMSEKNPVTDKLVTMMDGR